MDRYVGFIEDIKDDFVTCRLQREDQILDYYMDIPIEMIDEQYLKRGTIMHVYLGEQMKIEFPKHPAWTEKDLSDVQKRVDDLMNLKWC